MIRKLCKSNILCRWSDGSSIFRRRII